MSRSPDIQIKEIAKWCLVGYISGILKTRFGVIHKSLGDFRIGFSFCQMGKRM